MSPTLEELGWSATHAAAAAALDPILAPARVVVEHGGLFTLAGAPGVRHGVLRGAWLHEDDPHARPAVGDWVAVRPSPGAEVAPIEHLFERTSLFVRRAAGRRARAQVVAANVDVVFVVTGLDADFNPRRVERYVVAVIDAGAAPVVLLNKADLDPTAHRDDPSLAALPCPVLRISAQTGHNLEALSPWLGPGRTLAFVGSSGVGKSTLVNRLLGAEVQATGGVRVGDDKGRHTTTHRSLIPLPGGGTVIDTPGMREFGLHADAGALDEVFADVEALTHQCRFRDCTHGGEPGCAVQASLDAGDLDPGRWRSYRKLGREIAFEQRRDDQAARRADARRFQKVIQSARQDLRARQRMGWKG